MIEFERGWSTSRMPHPVFENYRAKSLVPVPFTGNGSPKNRRGIWNFTTYRVCSTSPSVQLFKISLNSSSIGLKTSSFRKSEQNGVLGDTAPDEFSRNFSVGYVELPNTEYPWVFNDLLSLIHRVGYPYNYESVEFYQILQKCQLHESAPRKRSQNLGCRVIEDGEWHGIKNDRPFPHDKSVWAKFQVSL